MTGEWSSPYPAGYREQLQAEAAQASLPRERKAAIVAELERMAGKRTADEDRGGVETSGVNPGVTGRHADPATDASGR
jgi:hypothetical protein